MSTLAQRIARLCPNIQVRHYHRKLPSRSGSVPFMSSSTARHQVMQQAFLQASTKFRNL